MRRRPTRIKTSPQPPRTPGRPPVVPTTDRPTASPARRLDNLGQQFLRNNQTVRTSQIPRVITNNVKNIYKPNPKIRNIV